MELITDKIKIFADGADLNQIKLLLLNPIIKGFTTNPTLMKSAGITNYEKFSRDLLEMVNKKPVSLEVFSDDFKEMQVQAMKINSWSENVYVKIPVTNTKGEPSSELIKALVRDGVKVNVTAVMTKHQILNLTEVLNPKVPSNISIFAGRIADTGVDPKQFFTYAKQNLTDNQNCQLIWASPRELLNVIQAIDSNCDIITITQNLLNKLDLLGKKLEDYSIETVKMFYDDAKSSGFRL